MTITADTLTDQKLADMTPLARARACTPLTIRDVAEALGIGYGILSQYETGQRRPKRQTQQRLADFYGVDRSYLFAESVNVHEDAAVAGVKAPSCDDTHESIGEPTHAPARPVAAIVGGGA